ncbi:MAG: ribonuclease domain-containing protein [Rhodanobacter sp.]
MRLLKPLIVLALIALAVGMWQRHEVPAPAAVAPTLSTQGQSPGLGSAQDDLPPEARAMQAKIARGGPFEHRQDGAVFGNYEGLLPPQPRGYYHEYTVETPGAGTRGARRIITGGAPPTIWYYTADHYRSFRRIEVSP